MANNHPFSAPNDKQTEKQMEPFSEHISNNHPYFMDRPVQTVLDEDTAVNINNADTPPQQ